ncbi:MAG: D-alanyl-D-alanine carboxypeptidase [Firmicutes bacterium]|nr:D-alanyl-D-alanine carboxypeptidase [Bacillota bacterium]
MKVRARTVRRAKKVFIAATVFVVACLMILGAVYGTAMSANQPKVKVRAHALTSAKAMITLEASTGRVLCEHNADQQLPMASTTKILTAITAIENTDSLDTLVKISDKAIGIEGTSIYLQKGEAMTVRDLLLGLMLRSGNDCSVALAIHISGSIEAFADLMNETARKAGATNSNFMNPHGLDETGHLTTARDLGLISAYAMRNETFREIVATKEARISGPDHPRPIQNKNRLLRSNPDIVGIKTGFTSKAGRCFVGAMHENSMTVICVVLNCGPMFPESEHLMESALEEFYMFKVLDREQVQVDGEKQVMVANDFFYPIRSGEESLFKITITDEHVTVNFDGSEVHRESLSGD